MKESPLIQRLHKLRERFANRGRLPGEKSRRGLTLVELAIVLLVLGIIMAIVFASIDTGVVDDAVRLKIKGDATALPLHLQRYEREVGQLEDRQSLSILAQTNPENPSWRPVKEDAILDAWKNPYQVRVSETGEKQIWSLGADKQEGGEGKNADFCVSDKTTWPVWLSGKAQ